VACAGGGMAPGSGGGSLIFGLPVTSTWYLFSLLAACCVIDGLPVLASVAVLSAQRVCCFGGEK